MSRRLGVLFPLLLALSPAGGAAQSPAAGAPVTVAVVRDGAAASGDLVPRIAGELRLALPSGPEVVFKESPAFDAGWTPEGAERALRAAFADPQARIVLVTGLVAGHAAAGMELPKPVVAAFPQRIDSFRLHDMEGDHSTKVNLAFMLLPQRAESDVQAFLEILPFRSAAVVLDAAYAEVLAGMPDETARLQRELGIGLRAVPVEGDTAAALAAVPPDADAVLLGQTPRLDAAGREALIAGLTRRRLPVFSLIGPADVERGALASRSPDVDEAVVRRSALLLSELVRGRSTSELPVILTVNPRLLVNGAAAGAIGYSPDLRTRITARFLSPEALLGEETALTLTEAMQTAETGNRALAASAQGLEAARQETDIARSRLFPHVTANVPYRYLNANAVGLEGLFPDQVLSGGLSVRQMLYDDGTVSDLRAQARLEEGSAARLEADRLDTRTDAAAAFLDLAMHRAMYRVRADFVYLTEENRDIARMRVEVGQAGPDEVFRWEAELAQRQADLLESWSRVESARVDLNRVLGAPQDTRWAPRETAVEPDALPFLDNRITGVLDRAENTERFRRTAVAIAEQNAPELASAALSTEAASIQLGERKRSWWLPVFTLGFDYDHLFAMEPELESVDPDRTMLEVRAQYPLFEGTARLHEVRRASAEVNRLGHEQEVVRELVEKRVRVAVNRLESSFPGVGLARTAADNAARNLDVVKNKYAQGLAGITDLVTAQNEAYDAEERAAIAGYRLRLHVIELQRSIAWFEDEKSVQEQDDLLRIILDGQTRP